MLRKPVIKNLNGNPIHPNEYLKSLLSKYQIKKPDVTAMNKDKENLRKIFQRSFKGKYEHIYDAGSQAKGTGINIKYDLDLCIYSNLGLIPRSSAPVLFCS